MANSSSEIVHFQETMPFYLLLQYLFIQPISVLVGAVGNSWILAAFLFSNVNVSRISKLYYVLMAFSDLLVCTKNCVWDVLCDSLWIITGGQVAFCFDTLSQYSCIFINLWYYLSEIVSNYAVAALSIERMIAIMVPFTAKRILGTRFTWILLAILIAPESLYFLIVVPIVSKVVSPFPRVNGALCFRETGNLLGYSIGVADIIIILTVHVIIDLIASIVVIIKLKKVRSKREEMCNRTTRKSSKETQAILTMLGLAISNLLLYGACFLARLGVLATEIFPSLGEKLGNLLNGIFLFAVLSTIIPHCLNFFIYLILLPSFRNAAFCNKQMTAASSAAVRDY